MKLNLPLNVFELLKECKRILKTEGLKIHIEKGYIILQNKINRQQIVSAISAKELIYKCKKYKRQLSVTKKLAMIKEVVCERAKTL